MQQASDHPSYEQLQQVKWTRKGPYQGNPVMFPDTARLPVQNEMDRTFTINLSRNQLRYKNGVWNDTTDTTAVPTTINPIVSENICLKKRVETLIRTAAISEIEVQQLKEEIREAKRILAQLAQVV